MIWCAPKVGFSSGIIPLPAPPRLHLIANSPLSTAMLLLSVTHLRWPQEDVTVTGNHKHSPVRGFWKPVLGILKVNYSTRSQLNAERRGLLMDNELNHPEEHPWTARAKPSSVFKWQSQFNFITSVSESVERSREFSSQAFWKKRKLLLPKHQLKTLLIFLSSNVLCLPKLQLTSMITDIL